MIEGDAVTAGTRRQRLFDPFASASPRLMIGVFLLSLVPLLVTPVVPAVDFYNHVGRYYILTHLDRLPYLRDSYAAAWRVLPNLGLDVVALPFFRLLPPLAAAKAIVALIFAVQFSGMLVLNRALNRELGAHVTRASVLLAGMLLYSYILGWGFANFLLASGVTFWGLAVWTRLRARLAVAAAVCSAIAVLIFFCHGFAFAMYGLTLALLEFGRWLHTRPRRFMALVAAGAAVAVQAVLPAILFRMAPTSEAGNSIAQQISAADSGTGTLASRAAAHALHQGMSIVRVADGPWLALDIVTFLLTAGLLVFAWRRGVLRIHPVARIALIVLALLSVLTPPSLFAVGKISDRVPLFAAMLLTATLVARRRVEPDSAEVIAGPRGTRFAPVLLAGLAAIFAVRLVAVTAGYARYADDFADFAAVAARSPTRAIVAPATLMALSERDHDAMRCEMYPPLILPLYGNPVPLFAFASQQPMRQLGEMAARSSLHSYGSLHGDPLGAAEPEWPYYLTCGHAAVPAGYDVVARRGRFMLLRARAPAKV